MPTRWSANLTNVPMGAANRISKTIFFSTRILAHFNLFVLWAPSLWLELKYHCHRYHHQSKCPRIFPANWLVKIPNEFPQTFSLVICGAGLSKVPARNGNALPNWITSLGIYLGNCPAPNRGKEFVENFGSVHALSGPNRGMQLRCAMRFESHTPKSLAMRFFASDATPLSLIWNHRKMPEKPSPPAKILRCWPAMRNIGVCFTLSDAKCLRFGNLAWNPQSHMNFWYWPADFPTKTWWTFRIFLILFLLGRGKGESEGLGGVGGGTIIHGKSQEGGGLPGGWGRRRRGAGRVFEGNLGGIWGNLG